MCVEAIVGDLLCESRGKLLDALGVGAALVDTGYYEQFYYFGNRNRHCLCNVDLEATAAKHGYCISWTHGGMFARFLQVEEPGDGCR